MQMFESRCVFILEYYEIEIIKKHQIVLVSFGVPAFRLRNILAEQGFRPQAQLKDCHTYNKRASI
jgi:hypothetical protein